MFIQLIFLSSSFQFSTVISGFSNIQNVFWIFSPANLIKHRYLLFVDLRWNSSWKQDFIYFFNLFIYFNWRLITLQYCIGFATHQHESTMGIHVFPILNPFPPPSLYHPSGSSQCTSPEHLVSCIEPGLAIHFLYDIIHVSMPFSQIIPPSPSHTEPKNPFHTSVSLLLSHIEGYHYHLSKFHMYVLVYCIGVFLSGLLHSV